MTVTDIGGARRPFAPSWYEEMVAAAIEERASDITLIGEHDRELFVRFKIDGVWRASASVPAEIGTELATHIRSRAEIPTTNIAKPESRAYRMRLDGAERLLRVSVFPTANGQKITIRLPARDDEALELDALGMGPENLAAYKTIISEPDGAIFVIGPVGHGKTRLLYATLNEVSDETKSVGTVEDPPERLLPMVAHQEVNEDAGATFEVFMRASLRASDDVMLLGEVRDETTARSVVQIAKSGTLVLTTLHAKTNLLALRRLTELSGQSPVSVAESVRAVVSQRLVRRLHEGCLGAECRPCGGTGYFGRIPIHELLIMTDELLDAIDAGRPNGELRAIVAQQGLPTMREDASRLIADGVTDEREIRRVLGHGN